MDLETVIERTFRIAYLVRSGNVIQEQQQT